MKELIKFMYYYTHRFKSDMGNYSFLSLRRALVHFFFVYLEFLHVYMRWWSGSAKHLLGGIGDVQEPVTVLISGVHVAQGGGGTGHAAPVHHQVECLCVRQLQPTPTQYMYKRCELEDAEYM